MIKIEHTQQIGGSSTREKILTEAIGGVVGYDLVDVVSELRTMYLKTKVLAGPFEWRKACFRKWRRAILARTDIFAGVAFGFHVFAYNPTLVPPERVPKKWEDCLDPYWKGRFVVDTRARIFANLSRAWGEAKTIDYVTKLKNNQPIWKRSPAETLPLLAIGEFPMVCGTFYQTAKQILRRDPTAKIAISVPTEVSTGIIETLGIMKGSKSPNAALLLAGYLASPQGKRVTMRLAKARPSRREARNGNWSKKLAPRLSLAVGMKHNISRPSPKKFTLRGVLTKLAFTIDAGSSRGGIGRGEYAKQRELGKNCHEWPAYPSRSYQRE
jgi:ABC-type Fe3+ transport system substrate-binding protein